MVRGDDADLENPLGVITRLKTRAFGVLGDQDIEFSPGINVVIGMNGTGKSQLLKLAYAAAKALYPIKTGDGTGVLEKAGLGRAVTEKMKGVFLPDLLGNLVTSGPGNPRCSVEAGFSRANEPLKFRFAKQDSTIRIEGHPKSLPTSPQGGPLFIPTREIMTLHPQLISLYENEENLGLDETYYDLSKALLGGPKKGPRALPTKDLLKPLEELQAGRVTADRSGRLFLRTPTGVTMEMPLVAEGSRKVSMLTHLISNGSLRKFGTIFWDEPETNLNPKLLSGLIGTFIVLAEQGVQVILATHSLFVMKEVSRCLADRASKSRSVRERAGFFSLVKQQDGGIEIERGHDLDELRTIVSLDAELELEARMDALYWKQEGHQ